MECYIVEALLRNYKDELTSDDTNRDIVEHLKVCKSCQTKLDRIEKDCYQEDRKKNKEQVAYLFKIRKTIKILAIIVASIGWFLILCLIAVKVLLNIFI